jgi:galactokinase
VIEDLAPGGVFGGAAAVALVDDDQVEEVRRQLAEQLLPVFRAGQAWYRPR